MGWERVRARIWERRFSSRYEAWSSITVACMKISYCTEGREAWRDALSQSEEVKGSMWTVWEVGGSICIEMLIWLNGRS